MSEQFPNEAELTPEDRATIKKHLDAARDEIKSRQVQVEQSALRESYEAALADIPPGNVRMVTALQSRFRALGLKV